MVDSSNIDKMLIAKVLKIDVTGAPENTKWIELGGLFIAEDQQGKNIGNFVAKSLLQAANDAYKPAVLLIEAVPRSAAMTRKLLPQIGNAQTYEIGKFHSETQKEFFDVFASTNIAEKDFSLREKISFRLEIPRTSVKIGGESGGLRSLM